MAEAFEYDWRVSKGWLANRINYWKKTRVYGSLSDEEFDQREFKKRTGRTLEISNPRTFTEKLLYLKRNLHDPLLTTCADKYLVREYLTGLGYADLLCPLYGVYDDAADICLNDMPKRFFIKCSSYSGANFYIDKDRSSGFSHLVRHLNNVAARDYYWIGREWPYKGTKQKILCEEALVGTDGALPRDYKFYCFGGELKYYMVSYGEYSHHAKNHKLGADDKSVDHLFKATPAIDYSSIMLPENIGEMKRIATELSKPFRHVRVDLYSVGGRIYFGELTFYQNGGFVLVPNEDTENLIGSWLDISGVERIG